MVQGAKQNVGTRRGCARWAAGLPAPPPHDTRVPWPRRRLAGRTARPAHTIMVTPPQSQPSMCQKLRKTLMRLRHPKAKLVWAKPPFVGETRKQCVDTH